MKTMFLIFGSAFLTSGLAWFFTWAIWVHSNLSAYGTGPDSMDMPMPPEEKVRMEIALVWVRRLRAATFILLVLTAITAVFALQFSEW